MKDRQKEMGVTLQQIAAATGLSYGMVVNVFNGHQKNPTSGTILPLLKFLNLRFEDVWSEYDTTDYPGPADPNREVPQLWSKLTPQQQEVVRALMTQLLKS